MGWIIFCLVWFLVVIPIVFAVGTFVRTLKDDSGPAAEGWGSVIRWAGVSLALFIWLIVTVVSMFHQVPAGHSGVVYEFGGIVGETDDGLQVIAPWRSIKDATLQVQTLCFIDDETKCPEGAQRAGAGLDSFSQETQNVYIDAVVRIRVDPAHIQDLYRNVGPNYINKLIPGSIAQIFKDETVKYLAVDLAPNRDTIREGVEGALREELSRFSIGVDALLIENISFDADFEAAILAKQTATQKALEEEANIAKQAAIAQQQIKTAEGTAARLRLEAQGQADANRLLAESLTPQLIQFQALQKLAPNIKIALLPSGQGIIIDPATILAEAP